MTAPSPSTPVQASPQPPKGVVSFLYSFFNDETLRAQIVEDTEGVARSMFGLTDDTLIQALLTIRNVAGQPDSDDAREAFATLGTAVSTEVATQLQGMSSDVVW